MSVHPKQFRELIVRPALAELARDFKGADSPAAEELMMLTAAQETWLGRWVKQWPNGPALGVFSMEPATYAWLWGKYGKVVHPTKVYRAPEDMVWDWRLAAKMARLRYWIVKAALPGADDLQGLAEYWDKYYNGNPTKGFPEEAVRNYRRFVLEERGL